MNFFFVFLFLLSQYGIIVKKIYDLWIIESLANNFLQLESIADDYGGATSSSYESMNTKKHRDPSISRIMSLQPWLHLRAVRNSFSCLHQQENWWIDSTGVVGLVVMGSLLGFWEVEVWGSNLTMESICKITPYSRHILTSIFDGIECTVMAYLDPLLSQARIQWVGCHYIHTQIEDTILNRPLPIFCYQK